MWLGEDPPRRMTRQQICRRARLHNGLQIGAGVLLVPTTIILWWASFQLVWWMFRLPLNALGWDGESIGLYIAMGAMALLAVEGVRHSAPLFDLGEFTQSDFYNNFIFQSDTGFALNWYLYSPMQIMWLVSQFLFAAPRTSVLALKSFRSLAPTDDATLADAAEVRRALAKSGNWTPAAEFAAQAKALLLLERLELIWVDRDGAEVTVRIPSRGE